MKQLLYIGNNLRQNNSNLSYIGVLGPLLESEGYSVTYTSGKPHKFLRLLDMLWSVTYYSRRMDMVLIDTYSTQNFYYALLVSQCCRWLGLPYIPILHGGNLSERLRSSPYMSRLLFRNSFVNVAPSEYLKTRFEIFGYDNLTYIPNVIEVSNYAFMVRQYNAPKLLWVRSFSNLYNPILAVKVLKRLRTLGYDASLCMVGPDSDGSLQMVQDFAEQHELAVTFTGKLSKQEWIALSADYNVFINTSTVDNTPLSVIEAMALGLPIVSTNVGGMPYMIEDGVHGLLVESDAVEAMVDAIRFLSEHPKERDQMVLRARRLSEGFDWELVKSRWKEVLD